MLSTTPVRRRIAGFSSLIYHYEMFGFIIHYCKENDISIHIYCDFRFDNGFIEFYKQTFQTPLLTFENLWGNFEKDINHYDAILLFSDEDKEFNVYHSHILNRTLMIEHTIFQRRFDIPHRISTRPFDFNGLLQEARYTKTEFNTFTKPSSIMSLLPTYPLLLPEHKPRLSELSRQTTVCILGGFAEYCIERIHRLKPLKHTDPKIKIIAISRYMEPDKFAKLDRNKFEIEIHRNLPVQSMMDILKKVDFIMTDVSKDNEYKLEKIAMSGCIPMAFSLLIPLIISKQTNQYYQFPNVIEFDKISHIPIYLETIDPQILRNDCEKIVNKNTLFLDQIFQTIFMTTPTSN